MNGDGRTTHHLNGLLELNETLVIFFKKGT